MSESPPFFLPKPPRVRLRGMPSNKAWLRLVASALLLCVSYSQSTSRDVLSYVQHVTATLLPSFCANKVRRSIIVLLFLNGDCVQSHWDAGQTEVEGRVWKESFFREPEKQSYSLT